MEGQDLQLYTDILIDFLQPIVKAAESPQNARALIMDLGYDPQQEVTAFSELAQVLSDVFDVIDSVDQLVESNSSDEMRIIEIILELLTKISRSIEHLINFSNKIQSNFTGSGILTDTDILTELPIKLVDLLFISYLERKLPKVHVILLFTGFIEEKVVEPANAFSTFYKSRKIHWEKFQQIFTDPVALIKGIFVESDSIKFTQLIYLLEQIGVSLGVFAEVVNSDIAKFAAFNQGSTSTIDFDEVKALRFPLTPDPAAELALELYPILNAANGKCDAVGAGLIFGSQFEIPLGDRYKLKIGFSTSLADGLGIKVDKNGNFAFMNRVFTSAEDLASSVQFTVSAKFEAIESPLHSKFVEIGAPGGNRFEIGSGSVELGISKERDDVNVYVELDLKDGLITIGMGGADSFVGAIAGGNNITSEFDLGVGFSNKGGVYFKGGSLEIALPVHIQLGPIEISMIALGLRLKDDKFTASISTSFSASLGPLQVVVENIGIKADIDTKANRDGNLGPLQLTPGFKPPNGLGLSINAGAVIGGGYLFFDLDKEEYAGVLELTIAGFISVKAIGLITTKMPDGSKGFSMLIIITAEFFPPFQLGYGFTLIGVGGLLGLNRTVLLDPLREGVRTGAINNIMFPQNVIANAPRIISDLKAIFPPYEGRFLIGPMAKIGWGTPTLISISFGLIIEIPGNLAILGVLSVLLPDKEVPIVKIQVAFVGTIDFDKKMLTFDASLYESSILTMTLAGDMALRLKWGDNPDFILTVGGFHPSYTPPPLALPTLRRLALNILDNSIGRIRVECYMAVTSNTVQFGAKAEVYFDLSVVSVEGYIAFDALFQFSPFYFIISLAAGFSVKVFGLGLFSIRVKMSLEGPTPWRAKGTGSISFFFFDVEADFDETWGERKNTTLPDIAILPQLLAGLNSKDQWSTALSTGKNLLVSLRKLDEAAESLLVLHPAGSLLVQQKLLPLAVNIDKVGNQKTSDVKQIKIASASSNGVPLTLKTINEDFARAHYQNLSNAEKLSKPSFEKMPGGAEVSMGDSTIKIGKMVRKNVAYELTIIDKEPRKPFSLGTLVFEAGVLFANFLKGNSAANSVLSQSYAAKLEPFQARLAVTEEGYTVAFQADNKAFNTQATFENEMMAQSYMQDLVQSEPSLQKQIHIVPNYELQV